MEYYRLGLLMKTKGGAEWRNIYFSIDENGQPKIVHTEMDSTRGCLNSKLEKTTEEMVHEVIVESGRDRTAG